MISIELHRNRKGLPVGRQPKLRTSVECNNEGKLHPLWFRHFYARILNKRLPPGEPMSDRAGDKSKQPPECEPKFTPFPPGHPEFSDPLNKGVSLMGEWSQCPNLKLEYDGWDGERWNCDVCGKRYFLDYEEMK